MEFGLKSVQAKGISDSEYVGEFLEVRSFFFASTVFRPST